MNKYLKYALIMFGWFIVLFMAGSFIADSMNPGSWSTEGRTALMVVYFTTGLFFFMAVMDMR